MVVLFCLSSRSSDANASSTSFWCDSKILDLLGANKTFFTPNERHIAFRVVLEAVAVKAMMSTLGRDFTKVGKLAAKCVSPKYENSKISTCTGEKV